MELMRQNAPGWLPEIVPHPETNATLWPSSVGASIMIRWVHISGQTTPGVMQAVMDNRNNSIPIERITSRDESDTFVRGICKSAALQFGLAYELWAKMPLESGYAPATESGTTTEPATATKKTASKSTGKLSAEIDTSMTDEGALKNEFIKTATSMGLCEGAVKDLIERVKGDFASGIKTLKSKDESFVSQMNAKFQADSY